MGDFNLNLLNHQNHDATGEFLDGLHSCMFTPLISLPSRITSHTATLIYNIFTNYFDHQYRTAGLLLADISDHLPIFSICSDNTPTHRARETIFVRNKNVENTKNFFEQLESNDWLQLPGHNDPKMCYDSFLNKCFQIYNTCFPLKKLKGKNQSRKPWLSKGLLKSVKRKNKLYKQYLSDPSSQKKALHKEYRNKLNHSLRIAKRLYYDKKLNESKNNLRATWRVLNDLINRRKPKVNPTQHLKQKIRKYLTQ